MNAILRNTVFFLLCFAAQLSVADNINWDEVVIIDVRSRAEWNQSRLENAYWIPWTQIEQGVKLLDLDPNQPIAFYCEAGIRAERAIRRLRRLGFNNMINLVNLEEATKATGFLIQN